MQKEERSCLGKWDVQSMISSSSEFYGPEKLGRDDKPRHLKFAIRNPVRCRIIWITLRLQRPGSSSVNFEKDFNLLALDENPFSQLNRRASFGGLSETEPCIHARRFLVVGSPARKEIGLTLAQGSDQINVKNWLERAPQLNRFKVWLMFLSFFIHYSSLVLDIIPYSLPLNKKIPFRFQLRLRGQASTILFWNSIYPLLRLWWLDFV